MVKGMPMLEVLLQPSIGSREKNIGDPKKPLPSPKAFSEHGLYASLWISIYYSLDLSKLLILRNPLGKKDY